MVSRLKIITDRDTGRSRGFAFVTMDSAEEAKAAIEDLDGKDNMGRALSVREATPRAPRDGGGGGGNYRGGGGGGNYRGGGGGGNMDMASLSKFAGDMSISDRGRGGARGRGGDRGRGDRGRGRGEGQTSTFLEV